MTLCYITLRRHLWYNVYKSNLKGCVKLTYSNDPVWEQAKEVARAGGCKNEWIKIIDYYNLNEGKNVNIFCAIEQRKYRILFILDSGKVLLLDRENQLVTEDYDIVEESRKVFFFQDIPEKETRELPEGNTFMSQGHVEFYV